MEKKQKTKNRGFRVDEDMDLAIAHCANKWQVTESHAIRLLVETGLAHHVSFYRDTKIMIPTAQKVLTAARKTA